MFMVEFNTLVVIDEVNQYVIILMVTLLFTVLALAYREDKEFGKPLNALAGICWLISAVVHWMVGDITNPVTYTIPLLYLVFGLAFILTTVINTIKMLKAPKQFFGED